MKLRHLLFALSLFTAIAFSQDLNSISTTQTGSITAAGTDCNGVDCVWLSSPLNTAAVTFQLSGTFSATITFEASTTGAVWSSLSSATTTGSYSFSLSGKRYVRARCSAYTSGTVVVNIGSSTSGGGLSAVACVGTPGNTTGAYQQQCQTAAGAIYACNNAAGCTLAADWVAQGGGNRILLPGTAAKCQSGVAGAGFSVPSSTFQPATAAPPAAICEADGFHAFLPFVSNGATIITDQFDLPSDWATTLKVVTSAWSAATVAPTITVSLLCLSTASTTGGTYGTAQTISLTPGAASGRTAVSTTLVTDAGHATKACAVGDELQFQLSVTPSTQATTMTTVSGSANITVAANTGLIVGQYAYGAGIPVGSTITTIVGTTITLSQLATASAGPGIAVTFANPFNLIALRFTE